MATNFFSSLISFLLLAIGCLNLCSAASYEEAHDANGRLRPAFAVAQGVFSVTPNMEIPNIMGDKIFGLSSPLVLNDEEYRTKIQTGMRQYVRAMHAFFVDVILGQGLNKGAFLKQHANLRRILDLISMEATKHSISELRQMWKTKTAQDVAFLLGPDLVRNSQGEWVVLEMNTGVVGGLADVDALHEAFNAHHRLQPSVSIEKSSDFLKIMRRYIEMTKDPRRKVKARTRIPVLASHFLSTPTNPLEHDLEPLRLIEMLDRYLAGFHVNAEKYVTQTQYQTFDEGNGGYHNRAPRMTTEKRIQSWSGIFNMLDAVDLRDFLEHLFFNYDTAVFPAPTTSILGHKSLLPFLEDMVRHYLQEEPVLKVQTTKNLTGEDIGSIAFGRNFAGISQVIKLSNGFGGEGVHLFHRMTTLEKLAAREVIGNLAISHPLDLYVSQEPVEISTLFGAYYVDIRPITAHFGNDDVYVSERPFGRAVRVTGNGKTNVSQQAGEVLVLRATCDALLGY